MQEHIDDKINTVVSDQCTRSINNYFTTLALTNYRQYYHPTSPSLLLK